MVLEGWHAYGDAEQTENNWVLRKYVQKKVSRESEWRMGNTDI